VKSKVNFNSQAQQILDREIEVGKASIAEQYTMQWTKSNDNKVDFTIGSLKAITLAAR